MNLTLSGGLDVRSQSAELKARSKTSLYKLLGVREDEPYSTASLFLYPRGPCAKITLHPF
jgi:hypothetical protein